MSAALATPGEVLLRGRGITRRWGGLVAVNDVSLELWRGAVINLSPLGQRYSTRGQGQGLRRAWGAVCSISATQSISRGMKTSHQSYGNAARPGPSSQQQARLVWIHLQTQGLLRGREYRINDVLNLIKRHIAHEILRGLLLTEILLNEIGCQSRIHITVLELNRHAILVMNTD